uniref:NADH-ubiquinone oxidoreductase chain 5 n=1 Tax=Trigonotylus caelestialium TaxID=881767 RepID=A0A0F6MY45_9HEMI|nr:NADH dehydrogenase subunit 5 [Trigonotylus caelestialium]
MFGLNNMYMLISFFLSFFGIFMLFLGLYFFSINYLIFLDWEILSLNSFSFCMSMILDYMSLMFMGCVFLISSMVVYYSHSYMEFDVYKYRFLLLVFMFILSMMMMIISPNLISILLGWDGLGLVSYALVIFFQNYNSYNAGMLTILTNRIGDVAILMSIAWMLNFGSWNYIYYLSFYDFHMYIIFIFLVLASFTKSAQIPFSSWLPAAMAAPTPVSALVHSSTLVTAGVYLLVRFSPLISNINCTMFIIFSMMTMFMSGLGANFEFDLKKIIALSTLSQLGLMMMILFLGYPMLAFFHLLSHAFFKALLFLCAGLIIHNMNNSQDIRDMGYVINMMPYSSSCFIVSSFSLCGLPFLSGFYSKDLILEMFSMSNMNFFYYLFFMLSIMFTVSYSFRLMNYLFCLGSGNYVFQSYHEDKKMMFSMILLVMMAIFMGSFFMWLLMDPYTIILPFYMKLMPIILVSLGTFTGFIFYNMNMNHFGSFPRFLLSFFGSMWFMPIFSTLGLYSYFLPLSCKYSSLMDSGWGEYMFSKSHYMYLYIITKINFILEMNNIKLFLISYIFIFMIIFI